MKEEESIKEKLQQAGKERNLTQCCFDCENMVTPPPAPRRACHTHLYPNSLMKSQRMWASFSFSWNFGNLNGTLKKRSSPMLSFYMRNVWGAKKCSEPSKEEAGPDPATQTQLSSTLCDCTHLASSNLPTEMSFLFQLLCTHNYMFHVWLKKKKKWVWFNLSSWKKKKKEIA